MWLFLFLLIPIGLITFFVIIDPLQLHLLKPKYSSRNIATKIKKPHVDKNWAVAIKRLTSVEEFLRSSNSKTGIRSYRDAIETIQETGTDLINSATTPLEDLVGITLRDSHDFLRRKIVGEDGQGYQANVIKEIPSAISKLNESIESRSASSVYLALIEFNFIVNNGRLIKSKDDRLLRKTRREFSHDTNIFMKSHYHKGEYLALDNFISKWKEKSVEICDPYIFSFISIISASTNKKNLAALRGSLEKEGTEETANSERKSAALLLIKATDNYLVALLANKNLDIYKTSSILVSEFKKISL